MSAVELVDLPAEVVVPDGVEAIEQYRVWDWNGSHLTSKNGQVWKPSEALRATCNGGPVGTWKVELTRYGMTLEEAQSHADRYNESQSFSFNPFGKSAYDLRSYLPRPSVEPPDGYGYSFVKEEHDAPHEHCTCGIYAAADTKHGYTGDVWGKVKMWGKVVPGEHGARSEFAYPSELHVPASLADDPAILAYGVPVIADSTPAPIAAVKRRFTLMRFAVAMNVGACALNLSLVGLHVFH